MPESLRFYQCMSDLQQFFWEVFFLTKPFWPENSWLQYYKMRGSKNILVDFPNLAHLSGDEAYVKRHLIMCAKKWHVSHHPINVPNWGNHLINFLSTEDPMFFKMKSCLDLVSSGQISSVIPFFHPKFSSLLITTICNIQFRKKIPPLDLKRSQK